MSTCRVLIVGNPGEVHIGRHLRVAAAQQGIPVELADVGAAGGGGLLLKKLLWKWDRRPLYLARFSRRVVQTCELFQPSVVIATGVCPLDSQALTEVQELGARVVNYSTDDPFNPAHRASWFLRALPKYDLVMSPRRTNFDDLARAGCRAVEYLPFAYAPDQHYYEGGPPVDSADVLFVGGADAARVPFVNLLLKAGLNVAVYGGYWNRHAPTRSAHRGFAGAQGIRGATASAKVNLILVRRANRDGHVMRSFEAAACGGCLLVEDTPEHREIFADTVTYFGTAGEMIQQARRLLANPEHRRASAEASYRRIVVEGRNTYAHRLQTILERACGS